MRKFLVELVKKFQEKKRRKELKNLKEKLAGKRTLEGIENINLNDPETGQKKEKLESFIEKHINEPEKLFEYIKGTSTPFYNFNNSTKVLAAIKEKPGFILPKKGLKALYLNLFLNKKIGFSTSEIFVVDEKTFNIHLFIYEFYRWYCYKMKLKGFDNETQNNFENIFEIVSGDKLQDLSVEDILNLKKAIKHEKEAIDFVKEMAQKSSQAKKVFEKIKEGDDTNI